MCTFCVFWLVTHTQKSHLQLHETLWTSDWMSAPYGSVATPQHTWWKLSSNLDCVQEFFSLFRWLSDHASNVCILQWHDCCQSQLFRLSLFHMRHHCSRIFSQFSAGNCANSGLSLPQSRFLRMLLALGEVLREKSLCKKQNTLAVLLICCLFEGDWRGSRCGYLRPTNPWSTRSCGHRLQFFKS